MRRLTSKTRVEKIVFEEKDQNKDEGQGQRTKGKGQRTEGKGQGDKGQETKGQGFKFCMICAHAYSYSPRTTLMAAAHGHVGLLRNPPPTLSHAGVPSGLVAFVGF